MPSLKTTNATVPQKPYCSGVAVIAAALSIFLLVISDSDVKCKPYVQLDLDTIRHMATAGLV